LVVVPESGLYNLCGRKFVGKVAQKLSGKFGEIRAKILCTSKNFLTPTRMCQVTGKLVLLPSLGQSINQLVLFGKFQLIDISGIYWIRRCLKVLGQRVNKPFLNERRESWK